MEQLQRINIKYFTENTDTSASLEIFLNILDGWKEDAEEWLDIADYLHLSEGVGVVLFGTKRLLSVDRSHGKYGILYSHRSGLTGTLTERFQSALEQSKDLTQKLLRHRDYPSELGNQIHALEVRVNDRYLIGKSSNASKALEPALRQALEDFLPQGSLESLSLDEQEGLWGGTVSLGTPWSLGE